MGVLNGQVQGKFLGLMAVSDQSSHKINQEVSGATVTCMFNLGNVFQLVVDRLDNRSSPQQQFVGKGHKVIFHVLTQGGNKFDAFRPQLVEEGLRDVPFVPEELTEKLAGECRDGLSVIHVARGELKGKQLTAFIDHYSTL